MWWGEEREDSTSAKLLLEPPQPSIKDLQVIRKFPKVLVRQSLKDTPVELPTAVEVIETYQEYYETQEAQAQAEQTVEYWLKKANYLNTVSLVFALVANFILLLLTIAISVGYKFRKNWLL